MTEFSLCTAKCTRWALIGPGPTEHPLCPLAESQQRVLTGRHSTCIPIECQVKLLKLWGGGGSVRPFLTRIFQDSEVLFHQIMYELCNAWLSLIEENEGYEPNTNPVTSAIYSV